MATALSSPSDLDRRRTDFMAVIRDPDKSDGAKLKAKVGMVETAREQIAAVTSREIAARVIDALECTRFGRAGSAGRTPTIPMFPHRKTG